MAITVVTPGPNLIRVDVIDDGAMTDFKAVLHILGHLPMVQGTFALDGRPFLDHTPLCPAGIRDGSVVALLPDLDKPLPCPPPPLSPQGGLQFATGSITRLFPGTLADAYEPTLSLYTGADGNADVQAAHDTPVESLLEYAAGLGGIPTIDIAILHPNAGSLGEHGPNICDVPGLSLWDRVIVHPWVNIDALSLLHCQGTQGRIQTRSLGSLQMRIRTDATGMQVWRRIMLQVQRGCPPQTPGREAHLVPHTLEITPPATTIWRGRKPCGKRLTCP